MFSEAIPAIGLCYLEQLICTRGPRAVVLEWSPEPLLAFCAADP